jgi:signal peptidase I
MNERSARPKPRPAEWMVRIALLLGSVVAGLILLVVISPTGRQCLRRYSHLGAFRVPSNAMCPTVCRDERIVADRDAYQTKSPQRGEIILFYHEPGAIFVKRVIGVGGDTVEPGLSGADARILVNGNPIMFPQTCGRPVVTQDMSQEAPAFPVTKVPEGSFFVVGDNLGNSNDSRIPGFGFVSASQLRGKPLLLYWSPGHSRIGCRVR